VLSVLSVLSVRVNPYYLEELIRKIRLIYICYLEIRIPTGL